ncbi:PREDICTED: uncharacterized protein LOC104779997 [Camelina sativa]|uniref:Uncharacterized protein LOC104779997 n=1 Tax=Camelina sativa TaxID=90675 RepID=A0ABM0YLB2_CAMSA|nr:PREDICTED: uncharacterized protein LOC104779997 [Camelina sativa]
MDSPIQPSAISLEEYEDLERFHDHGFVYKGKKRCCIADALETSKPPDPELDRVVEERNLRIRKNRTMKKLKRKQQSEIELWEILSNSSNAMQAKADRFRTTLRGEERLNAEETMSFPESSTTEGGREFGGGDASAPSSMLDELLFMAERQEAVINDFFKLCEGAENICRTEEEEKKQSFFDLPIWSSPTDLMTPLCDTD